MAIIYTYPVKTSPVAADKVLISDSEDNNKTKSVTIDDIRGATASGVTSIIAGTSNVTLPTGQTGDVTISVSGSADAVVETVRNNSGATIEKGQPLHITGVSGTTPTVEVADASDPNKMPVSGLAKEQMLNNSDGEMIISGVLEGIDTANINGSPAEAAVVYVNTTTGGSIDFLSANAPTTEANLIQNIGIVVKSSPGTSGSIQVTAIGRTNATPNLNQGSIFIGNASNQASSLAIGANTYVLTSNGTTASWAAPVDTNTNIANTNLQINTASRTLDLDNNSLTIIDTSTGASKNLFKFDQPGGTVPEFTVGSTASGYEGNITLEGNDASRTGILKFNNATGDYSTTIKANALQATNLNYTLPLTQTGNGILTNNGTGTLSWSTSISPTGIQFGGTGTILNSYEEGTWTPTAAQPTGTPPTTASSAGRYTRIGNTVHVTFNLVVTGSSSIGAAAWISGLPFTANSSIGSRSAGSLFTNSDANTPQSYPSVIKVSGNNLELLLENSAKLSTTSPVGLEIDAVATWYRFTSGTGITLEGSATYKVA